MKEMKFKYFLIVLVGLAVLISGILGIENLWMKTFMGFLGFSIMILSFWLEMRMLKRKKDYCDWQKLFQEVNHGKK